MQWPVNSLPEVADRISGIIEGYSQVDRRDISLIVSAVIEMAIEKPEEKVVLAGTANFARFSDDFPTTMHPVLEALEEQVVLTAFTWRCSRYSQSSYRF
jgi:heat-inducible transcriptional repressor